MLQPEAAGLAPEPPAAPMPQGPMPAEEAPLGTHATGGNEVPMFFGMDGPTYARVHQNVLRDPQKIFAIAELAMQYRQPQYLNWLERGYKAEQENAGEAAMRLIAGDTQGALQAFNASGRHKASAINAIGDGTYDVIASGPDGKQYTRRVDPQKEMLALLTPPQFIAHQDREKAIDQRAAAVDARGREVDARLAQGTEIANLRAATQTQIGNLRADTAKSETERKAERDRERAEHEKALRDIAQVKLDQGGRVIDAKIGQLNATADAATARGELARARAGVVGTSVAAGKPPNWNVINAQIAKAAKDSAYVKRTGKDGRPAIDGGRLSILASAAQQLAKKDPELAANPALALQVAEAKLNEIDSMNAAKAPQDIATIKAGEPGWRDKQSTKDYYDFMGVKNAEEAALKVAAKRTQEALADIGLEVKDAGSIMSGTNKRGAPGAVSGSISTAKPAGVTPKPAASSSEPAQPKNKAEYDALPSGSTYIHPKTGKPLIKT